MPNEFIVKNGLKVVTTTGTLLPPVLTTAQRGALVSPPTGSVIYNSDTAAYEVYNGTIWVNQIAYQNNGVNLFNYYNFI